MHLSLVREAESRHGGWTWPEGASGQSCQWPQRPRRVRRHGSRAGVLGSILKQNWQELCNEVISLEIVTNCKQKKYRDLSPNIPNWQLSKWNQKIRCSSFGEMKKNWPQSSPLATWSRKLRVCYLTKHTLNQQAFITKNYQKGWPGMRNAFFLLFYRRKMYTLDQCLYLLDAGYVLLEGSWWKDYSGDHSFAYLSLIWLK